MKTRKSPRGKPVKNAVRKQPDDRGEYRSFYVVMPDSPEFQALSPEARSVVYPLKIKLGRAGIDVFYLDALPTLSGWGSDTCANVVRELIDTHWIAVQGSVVWLRNGLRFEPSKPLDYDNGRKGVVNYLLTLPKLPIINEFVRYYGLEKEWAEANATESPTQPPPDPVRTPLPTPSGPPGQSGMRDEGIGMSDRERDDGKGDGSPTNPDGKQPSSNAAPFPAGAQAHEDPAGSSPPDQVAGNGTAANDQQQLIIERMAVVVKEHAASQGMDQVRRRSFLATARPICRGFDYTAWADHAGNQVPWSDRLRLLELALARLAAGTSADLRSALRYVIPQQYDPFERTRAEHPAPGSEHEQVAAGGRARQTPQDVSSSRNGKMTRVDGFDPEKAEREAEKRDIQQLADWEREHPAEAKELLGAVAREMALDPKWKAADEVAIRIAATGLYRKRIREQLEAAPPRPELIA